MDIATPLALTAIFPGLLGVIFLISSAVMWDNGVDDAHEQALFSRFIWSGGISLGIACLGWIVAIWLGFAQSAGVIV